MAIVRGLCAFLLVAFLSITIQVLPAGAQTRRAVLVGINTYVPANTTLKPTIVESQAQKGSAGRGSWSNLDGSLNDVASMRQLLITRFGFKEADVHVLTQAQATREGIRGAIKTYLVDAASAGDISFFYYAGHGSQMKNSKSPEADKLDETIVPADSYAGALDIRDKELARDFMAVLHKGAVLTAIFDSCHSGSIARGFSRWDKLRDLPSDTVHDAADDYSGPFPEQEGALIFSAAQDIEPASEGRDDQGTEHGAFTAALTRVLASAAPNEPANSIFRRTIAVMRFLDANQVPVIAGTPQRLQGSLFGSGSGNISGKLTLPLTKINPDGTVEVLGGFGLGLGIGSQIVYAEKGSAAKPVRVEITDQTLSTSSGKILEGDPSTLKAGVPFVVDRWVSAGQGALKLWVSPPSLSEQAIQDAAGQIAKARSAGGMKLVDDPSEVALTHFISWTGKAWVAKELRSGKATELGTAFDPNRWGKNAELASATVFVNLPLPISGKELIAGLGAQGFPAQVVDKVEGADYLLIGRAHDNFIEYAWLRPGALSLASSAKEKTRTRNELSSATTETVPSSLPARSGWVRTELTSSALPKTVEQLESLAGTLSRINSWLNLSPPPTEGNFPYHLIITEAEGPGHTEDHRVAIGDGRYYGLALKANEADLKSYVDRRKVYVFVIDSDGNGVPLFPSLEMGDVENVFPTSADTKDGELPVIKQLGAAKLFQIGEPFGTDTYFLLTIPSKESIDLGNLNWKGVRDGSSRGGGGGLNALLSAVGTRSPRPATPSSWSLERIEVVSKPSSGTKP